MAVIGGLNQFRCHFNFIMDCGGCVVTLKQFLGITGDEETLLEWLKCHGVLRRELRCVKCGAMCTIKSDFRFKCGKTVTVAGKKSKKTRCNFSLSARSGTWFAFSKLPLQTICDFTCYWAVLRPPRTEFLMRECGLASHAVTDWSNYCRELCVEWCETRKQKIGGVGCVVEIDEAKIGRRKYNRGSGRGAVGLRGLRERLEETVCGGGAEPFVGNFASRVAGVGAAGDNRHERLLAGIRLLGGRWFRSLFC